MKRIFLLTLAFLCELSCLASDDILPVSIVNSYVDAFNRQDMEIYQQYIPNSKANQFLSENIPLFECPDKTLERIYYFRWWTYRKHIKQTPEGFIITEFLPDVRWAGKYNGISCPAMFHFNEGRWLHDYKYLNDYAYYWLRGGGSLRTYSFPIAYSLYQYYLVTGDDSIIKDLYPELVANFNAWKSEKYDEEIGLYWQADGQDGMEESICGGRSNTNGYRVTINSYMAAEAKALASIATLLHNGEADFYLKLSTEIKENMLQRLWDEKASFFKVLSKNNLTDLCNARELHGYTPWCFGLASEKYASAWQFLMDRNYFYAPYGLTTAEQCHPDFKVSYEGHECQWNGPSWPFSTSITIMAVANLLRNQKQSFVTKKDYLDILLNFAKSHQLVREDCTVVPWIDENMNPYTGDWIARRRLEGGKLKERGKDYNHSSFCDLVISGLIGFVPLEGNEFVINPLIENGIWDYFCLDKILYKGKKITILYDKTGNKYHKGLGLMVFVNGEKKQSRQDIGFIKCEI